MREIDAFLARPCGDWRYDAQRAAWAELVVLVAGLAEDAVHEIDARLARAYERGGQDGVCFEDDQRIAPLAWMFPTPQPVLVLARELSVALQPSAIDEDKLLAAARSPLTLPLTRLSIAGGNLQPILPELLATPLFDGLDTLRIRNANIGSNDGLLRLAATPSLASVTTLDIAFCSVHEEGLEAILASPHLHSLAWLTIDANCIDEYGDRGQGYWDDLLARLAERRIEIDFV
jgi:hypothetical protein